MSNNNNNDDKQSKYWVIFGGNRNDIGCSIRFTNRLAAVKYAENQALSNPDTAYTVFEAMSTHRTEVIQPPVKSVVL